MAINGPRLAVDPLYENTRAKLSLSLVRVTTVKPPLPLIVNDPVDGIIVVQQVPTRKGEIILYRDIANNTNTLMVAVEVGLNFEWKEVRFNQYYGDSSTGLPFSAL